MKTPLWWYNDSPIATLLAPLSCVYQVGATLRTALVNPQPPAIPTLCIGNVVAGGGGKTPLACFIGTWCQTHGINAYFISRGYGGVVVEPTLITPHHSAFEVGDEPKLLSKILPIIVAKDRLAAIKLAAKQGASLAIMDDGFQNPTIQKTASILVLKGKNPLGNGRIIPAGPLREPLFQALARADCVVWIDSENAALSCDKPLFRASTKLAFPTQLKRVIGFAGIARPELFEASLKEHCELLAFHSFADHHAYTPAEINRLNAEAARLQATLVTTEKDWVRLSAEAQKEIKAVPLSLEFENPPAFDAWLTDHITR